MRMLPIHLHLVGHLSESGLRDTLSSVQVSIDTADKRVQLVFDCLNMSGYDLAARVAFVEWNARNKERVSAVAVVTQNSLWRVVVATMALVSRQTIKAFATIADADAWCVTAAADD